MGSQRRSGCMQVEYHGIRGLGKLNHSVRYFGYSQGIPRTNSHFGRVEEGTQFAASDHRSFVLLLAVPKKSQKGTSHHVFKGAKDTRSTCSIVGTQSSHAALMRLLVSPA